MAWAVAALAVTVPVTEFAVAPRTVENAVATGDGPGIAVKTGVGLEQPTELHASMRKLWSAKFVMGTVPAATGDANVPVKVGVDAFQVCG